MIGYASKSLPKACVNYGFTELEMTGLLVNMENWKFYLGRKDFDAALDHRAISYIMKSKELLTTDRIIRILQRLGRFNFHLYYVSQDLTFLYSVGLLYQSSRPMWWAPCPNVCGKHPLGARHPQLQSRVLRLQVVTSS